MTPVAVALPDAAVRMVRAVAGRRALQVVVLLAGLLALGFLCGERAQAADGVPAPERVKSVRVTEPARATEPVRERVAGRHVADAVGAVDAAADGGAGGGAAEPVGRAGRDVARPVVDEVGGVLGGTPSRVLPEAPERPAFPALPSLPAVPAAPELPQPAPATGGDADAGDDSGAEPPSPQGAHADQARKASGARGESAYGTGIAQPGYAYPTGGSVPGGDSCGGGSLDEADRSTGHEPFPVPGDPGRTLGGQSAGDGGSTRHGDPCAASPGSRAPVRLLQGGGASQVPATIRDRHRDIPEFPG
ncbi:hypothetical protein [Streptomyces sp. NPDC048436]|uniref:hypothetical protein n=1 Tax=Streptomyces sp. NPDC048436 TaxID=3365550 RepID=UPI003710F57A